jgi:hypothetical protein
VEVGVDDGQRDRHGSCVLLVVVVVLLLPLRLPLWCWWCCFFWGGGSSSVHPLPSVVLLLSLLVLLLAIGSIWFCAVYSCFAFSVRCRRCRCSPLLLLSLRSRVQKIT